MLYKSTRGDPNLLTFEQCVLKGLAPDGGLYIPSSLPQISRETLLNWSQLSFTDLATSIFELFICDEIPREELKEIVEKSFSTFTHPDIAPLVHVSADTPGERYVMGTLFD